MLNSEYEAVYSWWQSWVGRLYYYYWFLPVIEDVCQPQDGGEGGEAEDGGEAGDQVECPPPGQHQQVGQTQ